MARHKKGCNCRPCILRRMGKPLPEVLRFHTSITPAARCAPQFSFAQCTVCKNVYSVAAKGRVPRCDDPGCLGPLRRIQEAVTASIAKKGIAS